MERRYLCLTCYTFHPEMKGVSEEEFKAGNNVCKEEKCAHKGKTLEAADHCDKCDKMFPAGTHTHE